MVDFEAVEVKNLRESAPSFGSMRNGVTRSKISDNRGLAKLIVGASGTNLNVDK